MKSMLKSVLKFSSGTFVFLTLMSCSTSQVDRVTLHSSSATSTETPNFTAHLTSLTHDQAASRSKMIAHPSYTLNFDLSEPGLEFKGKTTVHFDLKPKAMETSQKLFLDFEGGTLQSLVLNGVPLPDFNQPKRFDGHHVIFTLSELKQTGNAIELAYTHPYSKDGRGLHRFQDPVDENVYLYSHFEPYDAHRVFPCFDQPDLKATYELSVIAPESWQVISNALPKNSSILGKKKSWNFPTTAAFSTYVFALHAGPYSVWESKAENIPIRLFSRKSLAQHIDHEEWLKVTTQGLDYFGVQFGFPYPFGKYDQIIVPDFNAGAMENVGAVTFSENFVFRSHVTLDRRRKRAETILHEMAHMWFGDLVTMRWWNGLWLNESFATFMSANAVDQATEFKGTWQGFFGGSKQWAYWEDQLVTTHPIELPIPDTQTAQSIFDGITYGKGASVLKQLHTYLGDDDFREGLQRYFQKYAYRNSTLNDFFKMLSEASSTDLTQWQHSWLQTTGVNSIQAEWECKQNPETEKSEISKFNLIQTPSLSNEIRLHHTLVGLFYFPKKKTKNHSNLDVKDPFEVSYSHLKDPVPEAIGKPCPDLVFPNYEDNDYSKIILDPISLDRTLKSIDKISDSLTREMLWHTLWEMMIDGKIRPQDYAESVIRNSPNEKDLQILSKIISHLVQPSSNSPSVLKFLDGELRKEYQSKFETLFESQFLKSPGGSDQQLIWYQAFLNSASTATNTPLLMRILNEKQRVRGFKIEQERRWEIIHTLARQNTPDVLKIIDLELKKDATDMGQKAAIAAEASIPDPVNKKKWLDQMVLMPQSMPIAKLRIAMSNFQSLGQEALTQTSADQYFQILPKMTESTSIENEELVRNFSSSMFPSLCDQKTVDKTTVLLDSFPHLPPSVIKSLKVHRQEEERCIRARSKSHEAQ